MLYNKAQDRTCVWLDANVDDSQRVALVQENKEKSKEHQRKHVGEKKTKVAEKENKAKVRKHRSRHIESVLMHHNKCKICAPD